jgi:hypothetical protein
MALLVFNAALSSLSPCTLNFVPCTIFSAHIVAEQTAKTNFRPLFFVVFVAILPQILCGKSAKSNFRRCRIRRPPSAFSVFRHLSWQIAFGETGIW